MESEDKVRRNGGRVYEYLLEDILNVCFVKMCIYYFDDKNIKIDIVKYIEYM